MKRMFETAEYEDVGNSIFFGAETRKAREEPDQRLCPGTEMYIIILYTCLSVCLSVSHTRRNAVQTSFRTVTLLSRGYCVKTSVTTSFIFRAFWFFTFVFFLIFLLSPLEYKSVEIFFIGFDNMSSSDFNNLYFSQRIFSLSLIHI